MDVNEQIENLKALGLKIENEDKAATVLNDVSYFRLIKAYSVGLKPKNGNYDNIGFNEILELYTFNSSFRYLVFEQIERVEVALRCRISNYFSVEYGIFGYERPENFGRPGDHAKLLADIESEINRNERSPFVKNFRRGYEGGKIPFYACVELFSFGTLSKFYKNMKNSDKKVISDSFGVGYNYFESWIEHISYVRNVCAHYGRLYNVNIAKTPRLYKEYSAIGNLRVFATLICLKHLLPNDDRWLDFVDEIELYLEKYPRVQKQLMGFPDNWKELLTNADKTQK